MAGMNMIHLWKKTAFVLIVLALCLVSVAVVADESFPIPSGLITAQSLDQVTEENIAVGGATISNRELRIKFDYNDPDYWTLFWPYNASVLAYYGNQNGHYSGSDYMMNSRSTPEPYSHYQVTVRYDETYQGPCWYVLDVRYNLSGYTNYVDVTYHTKDMEGTLDYIHVMDWENRHYYYYTDGIWYQGQQSFIGEWVEKDSSTGNSYVAADMSELDIPPFEPVSFSYFGTLTICHGTRFPQLTVSPDTGFLTRQFVYMNFWAYGSDSVQLVYDLGEGTEETAEPVSYREKGNGWAQLEHITPTTSQIRRYWARATYPDGEMMNSEPIVMDIQAPNGSFEEPEINAQYTNTGSGMNKVTVTVTSAVRVDRCTVEICPEDGEEPLSTQSSGLPAGTARSFSFWNIGSGRYTIRATLIGQGYEETVFTRTLRIQKTYANVASIPADATEIGSEAFAGTDIEFVRIPASVLIIMNEAFARCDSLEVVEIDADDLTIEAGAFPEGIIIRCHEGSAVETWALENGYEVEPLDD